MRLDERGCTLRRRYQRRRIGGRIQGGGGIPGPPMGPGIGPPGGIPGGSIPGGTGAPGGAMKGGGGAGRPDFAAPW